MFMGSRGAWFVALTSAAEFRLRHRPRGDSEFIILQVLFVGVIAALFLAWLTSANTRMANRWAASGDLSCESFGRGGARCASPVAGHAGSGGVSDSRAGCESMGRGGLICGRAAN
jgi:hypothetical protein